MNYTARVIFPPMPGPPLSVNWRGNTRTVGEMDIISVFETEVLGSNPRWSAKDE